MHVNLVVLSWAGGIVIELYVSYFCINVLQGHNSWPLYMKC